MIESIDPETGILYFRISMRRIVDSDEVLPGFVVDFDADGGIVGIEFLPKMVGPLGKPILSEVGN